MTSYITNMTSHHALGISNDVTDSLALNVVEQKKDLSCHQRMSS